MFAKKMFQAKNLEATQSENRGTVQADRSQHRVFWLWSPTDWMRSEIRHECRQKSARDRYGRQIAFI